MAMWLETRSSGDPKRSCRGCFAGGWTGREGDGGVGKGRPGGQEAELDETFTRGQMGEAEKAET